MSTRLYQIIAISLAFFLINIHPAIAKEIQHDLSQEPILQALTKELKRSQENLRISEEPAPYFISYLVTELNDIQLSVTDGSVYKYHPHTTREAFVEIRVGDRHFDNTYIENEWMWDQELQRYYKQISMPIDDDISALRRALWRQTDEEYKYALKHFYRKKLKNVDTTLEPDTIVDDFSVESAVVDIEPKVEIDANIDKWTELLKTVTKNVLTDSKNQLTSANAILMIVVRTQYYANTEGSIIRSSRPIVRLQLFVDMQAEDGIPLKLNEYIYRVELDKLPPIESIQEKFNFLSEQIILLSKADQPEPNEVPMILMGKAAGVFFHEAIGHRLEGSRQKDRDEGQTFINRVGEKILPEYLNIYDDPTTEFLNIQNQKIHLNGYYKYDQEGQPAQKVVLIDRGKLQGFLMSRSPIKGFQKSNGHGRSDGKQMPMGRMGNLIIKSDEPKNFKKLKSMLIEEIVKQQKPFGLIIKRVSGGDTATRKEYAQAFREDIQLAYQVFPDGSEKLVRGIQLIGTPLASLGNNIIATGDDPTVFNGYCGAKSGWILVSSVSPSILFQGMEFQKSAQKKKRHKILDPPKPMISEQ